MKIRTVLTVLALAGASVSLLLPGRAQGQGGVNQNQTQKSDTSQHPSSEAVHAGVKVPQAKDAGAIPANAERIDGSHFRAKDEKGEWWNYTKTPFGVVKYKADGQTNAASTADVSNWKVKDLGDSVRFEKPTPFGPSVWTKKKSGLNDAEKLALAKSNPAPATSAAASETPKK